MHTLQLPQFSGPLDLLLTLIQEEKLAITEVSIAKVTEQFLQYLDTLEERRPEELADFLVIAARLLLLKSRTLLPQFGAIEDDGPSLEDQLRLYKIFIDASRKLNKKWMDNTHSFFRVEPARTFDDFVSPGNVTLEVLHKHMLQLITRLTPPKPLPQTHIDRAVSMKQKIDYIRTILGQTKKLNFQTLLSNVNNKTEVIVSFLALLELVKMRFLTLAQYEGFGDITIERV